MNVLTEEQQEMIANWKQPAIKVGDCIVWLSDFRRPDSECSARVTRVSMRSIECRVDNRDQQMYQFDVRHKDDPGLVQNTHIQRNGAWDFSDQEYRLRAVEGELAAIRAGIGRAVETVNGVATPAKRGGRMMTPEQMKKCSENLAKAREARKAKLENAPA